MTKVTAITPNTITFRKKRGSEMISFVVDFTNGVLDTRSTYETILKMRKAGYLLSSMFCDGYTNERIWKLDAKIKREITLKLV